MGRRSRTLSVAVLAALIALVAAACGGGGGGDGGTAAASSTAAGGAAGGAAGTAAETVRLAYFPNLTHASAIVGVEQGIFAEKLGATTLETQLFNAGPDVVTAIFSGAIDAAYIGPNPAINAFAKSDGEAIRIVSGATSGGASLVVRAGIEGPEDLKGRKLATPQLGGTQDIAARNWLRSQGLRTDVQGGGDVSVVPQENAQTLEAFKTGAIDAAWVPEPWATRLVQEGGGTVLFDEQTLWPGGRFVTTHLIVATEFLERHPATVRALIEGQVAANDAIAADPEAAKKVVNDAIATYTGKAIAAPVIDAAWTKLTFTNDPIAASLRGSATAAEELGLLQKTDLDGIYDLTLLNEVLAATGDAKVNA